MAKTLNLIPSLCRCCHKNGVFKSLFPNFIYENEIENYSQMLCDTFGILFESSERDTIYTICDECIEKLHISMEFKNSVLASKKNYEREPLIENDVPIKIEKCWSHAGSDKEEPLLAVDIKVEREETANNEHKYSDINKVLDEECNEDVKVEESRKESDETFCESEVSLRNTSGSHENKCNICNKTFRFKRDLENHIRSHDGYKYQICPEIFSNERGHMETKHVFDDKYYCTACDATFLEVNGLKCHIKTHLRHRCAVCNKHYMSKGELRSHEMVHKDEKKFKCSICNNLFTQHQSLKVHMETHTGRTLYECRECDGKFTDRSNLLRHCRNVHMGVKKYSCQYCDKRITTKQRLVIHERSHTGLKPYSCEKCGKNFISKGTLRSHNKVHLAHKPYICNMCDKAYKRKDTFNRHMLTHTGIKSFQCSVCSKTFAQKYHLSRHTKVHDDKRPYKCDICKKTLKSKRSISEHMVAVHLGFKPIPTECDICKKTFKSKGILRNHMLAVHLGCNNLTPSECDICKKTFKYKQSLRRHMSAEHLGIKPNECNICRKTFKYKQSIRKHILAVHLVSKLTPTVHLQEDI